MERDAADVGALSFVRVVRVWRRERDSNLPMVGVGSPEVSARGLSPAACWWSRGVAWGELGVTRSSRPLRIFASKRRDA